MPNRLHRYYGAGILSLHHHQLLPAKSYARRISRVNAASSGVFIIGKKNSAKGLKPLTHLWRTKSEFTGPLLGIFR